MIPHSSGNCFWRRHKLSAEDGFLQFMIERLLESNAPAEAEEDEEQEENGDEMKLTSIQSITDFMTCAAKHCRIISDSGPEESGSGKIR